MWEGAPQLSARRHRVRQELFVKVGAGLKRTRRDGLLDEEHKRADMVHR